MSTPILNGAMSGSVASTGPLNKRGKRNVCIRAQWDGTGSPQGVIGCKTGGATARMQDIGSLAGFSRVTGAQPDGTTNAGSIMVEFESGADWVDVYYTRTGGGTANTSLIVDVTFS
jgi:hypothetical protein